MRSWGYSWEGGEGESHARFQGGQSPACLPLSDAMRALVRTPAWLHGGGCLDPPWPLLRCKRQSSFPPPIPYFDPPLPPGVSVHPVYSDGPESWTGARGYVQAALAAAWPAGSNQFDAQKTGVVLCGQKPMVEEATAFLTARWGHGAVGDVSLRA